MPWFLNSAWRWFKWICYFFFNGCFLKLNIIKLIIANVLWFLILFKFLFSKITFKLYLRLDKWLSNGIVILQLSRFNLINNCYWTFWYRRVILFSILFNWCEMALSQIILIIRSKSLNCLVIFLLLRRLDFEILIIILSCILKLCIIANRLVLVVLVFVY